MAKIIAIAGRAQNGKDTGAAILMEALTKAGYTYTQNAFADLLKDQARALGWDGVKDDAGRTLLQELSGLVKNYFGNQNYYAEYSVNYALNAKEDFCFITDVRYKNEYQLLKDNGAQRVQAMSSASERRQ